MASLIGAFALAESGCEWVLGGIPDQPRIDADGGFDGSGSDADVTDVDARAAHDDSGAPDDANLTDDSAVNTPDGEIADASDDAGGFADADVDAGPPEPCMSSTIWYRDNDRDGFGVTTDALQQCPKPAGNWASRPGDCQDDLPAVNPGQVHYFDVAYSGNDGADSFDYDCDGQEVGSGKQAAGLGNCGALGLAACDSGSGFSPTSRSGDGVDDHCGSRSYQTCKSGALLGALVCMGGTTEIRPTGYVCR